MRADDSDEFALKEFVSVEEYVVGIPCTGGGKQAETKVFDGQTKRLGVVTGDM